MAWNLWFAGRAERTRKVYLFTVAAYRSSPAVGPVARAAALVGNRNDPKEVRLDLIDDAEGKAAKRETACTPSPGIANERVFKQSGN